MAYLRTSSLPPIARQPITHWYSCDGAVWLVRIEKLVRILVMQIGSAQLVFVPHTFKGTDYVAVGGTIEREKNILSMLHYIRRHISCHCFGWGRAYMSPMHCSPEFSPNGYKNRKSDFKKRYTLCTMPVPANCENHYCSTIFLIST